MEIKNGHKYTFNTTDSELQKYNGTKAVILRPLTENECDIDDVGMMYKAVFEDGSHRDVFEDELSPEDVRFEEKMKEIAQCIASTLEHCGFDDVTDSSGYYVIREFDDESERAVDAYKSANGENPHYVVYCSYENEDSDYKYTEDLSVEQLASKLEEFYAA